MTLYYTLLHRPDLEFFILSLKVRTGKRKIHSPNKIG